MIGRRRRPGWYILLYHEVSPERSDCLSMMGSVHCPDVFGSQVEALVRWGKVLPPAEALRLHLAGEIREPVFSFWFDDGFAGVREHALLVLDSFGLTAAVAVCSEFASGTDLFWRCKLSYLLFGPERKRGAALLREWVGEPEEGIPEYFMNAFSLDKVVRLDALYREVTSPETRARHLRLFDDPGGIRTLRARGWEVANHSARHYPIGERQAVSRLEAEFLECEAHLQGWLGEPSFSWVLPFDRPGHREPGLADRLAPLGAGRPLGLVEERANRRVGEDNASIYRIPAPFYGGRAFRRWLRRLP